MNARGYAWVVVLAAGEGTRLRSLTTMPSGISVPKQFCSLTSGGPSLMEAALRRASRIVTRERICVVVAAQHRQWWRSSGWSLPASNVIVQPQNRGTAIGMLLALLQILSRDPFATIVWLPSDHHVQQETVLAASIRDSLRAVEEAPHQCVLLGMEPDEADPELGYIVPGGREAGGLSPVERFVEKPSLDVARQLIEQGALWNGFIVIARACTLLRVFDRSISEIVRDMRAVLDGDRAPAIRLLRMAALYTGLPTIDFSRRILQGRERDLRVLQVPQCGWSDLGTPDRLAVVLRRMPSSDDAVGAKPVSRAALDLSTQRCKVDQGALNV